MSTHRTAEGRVRSSLRTAVGFAAVYSVIVIAGALLSHGKSLEWFQRSLIMVVGFHFAAAIFVGVLAGMFSKWATTSLRGALLGMGIGFPVMMGTMLVFRPEGSFSIQLISAVISAVVMGGIIGAMATVNVR